MATSRIVSNDGNRAEITDPRYDWAIDRVIAGHGLYTKEEFLAMYPVGATIDILGRVHKTG